ncbi:MAG: hypothetical protein ACYTGQ_07090 [Planctomycetota bacterium]
MAILHAMNKEDRLANRQAVMPKTGESAALTDDVSGEWICFTTMRLNPTSGMGIMQINLEHDGEKLKGEGGQLKHPFDPPATIRPIGGWTLPSGYVGRFFKHSPRQHNLIYFERRNAAGDSWALFTAAVAADGRTAIGQIVNRGGHYGSMLMVRREALVDFQHLLTEEGRAQEAARRLEGVEELEAAFDEKSLDTARNQWWILDRNKDGVLSYQEFPHPHWTHANRNGDDDLDWAEELADRILRTLARQGEYAAKFGASPKKEWASIYEWGAERPGFEHLFPYIDWDRDGQITEAEYEAFDKQTKMYIDPAYPKTNEKGQTGMDILRSYQQGQAKARKTSWGSQEEWDRDKPTVKWIFPFIDSNDDGKIDSVEYQAIQDYKKKHPADWQDRAREALGL